MLDRVCLTNGNIASGRSIRSVSSTSGWELMKIIISAHLTTIPSVIPASPQPVLMLVVLHTYQVLIRVVDLDGSEIMYSQMVYW